MSETTNETTKPKQHKFKLSEETREALLAFRNALDAETAEHREEWEDRSERWQDSEKGQAVDAWIEELGDLVDTLDNVSLVPEEG